MARQTIDGFTTAIMVVISVCFLPASYAIFVVKEREVKAKHQQVISGVGVYAYWVSTFLFDVVSYLVPFGVFIGLIHAFNVESYTKGEAGVATVLLFLLYGAAVAPFTYCLSFLFKSHSSAQNVVLFLNFVTGLALMVTSFVLNLIESTRNANRHLKWLYRLFPGFCLGDGLVQLVLCQDGESCVDLAAMSGRQVEPPEILTPLSWAIAGADVVFLALSCVGYLALCLLIEYASTFPKLLRMIFPDPTTGHSGHVPGGRDDDDYDVAVEADRVFATLRGGGTVVEETGMRSVEDDVVVLKGLRKVYRTGRGPKVAVHCLSFGIREGDCFGFLGINGAGKSSTLSILSGEIAPTSGAATIAGHNILTQQSKIRRHIGYCPQEDALFELLTVEEHLKLYARIKGVKEGDIDSIAKQKTREMDLQPFYTTKAGELSGGNKRKLSVAIAMIGNPKIVFLDEPSTGMDPIARRFMWEVISRMTAKDKECCVVLTTHSMEEAEALSNRIGIMVNGRLRCLGSAQHLKQRFGRGFEADLKLRVPSQEESQQLLTRLLDNLNGSVSLPGAGEADPEITDYRATVEEGGTLDRIQLVPPLARYCRALGASNPNSMRTTATIEALSGSGTGAFLSEMIDPERGTLPARLFCEWYVCEERANDLHSFLTATFDGAELVERPTLYSSRYKLPQQPGMGLANVFANFEGAKKKLGLAEYSVGQTTLEQIFNFFAATQDNPEVRLRTVMDGQSL
ncbi:unnamed protein product [Discosporangium mesarthrocarpum]